MNKLKAEKNERPLLSFVLIAYNQEDFILDAIEGALSQSYSPLEIILSDDSSSDKTFSIMQEVVADYEGPHRIILNKTPHNMGLGAHLNLAFNLCSGQLLIAAAGDDISTHQRVELLYEAWEQNNRPSMICSGWSVIDRNGDISSQLAPQCSFEERAIAGDTNVSAIQSYLDGKPFDMVGATAAYTKDLRNFRILDSNVVAEDFSLCLRALLLNGIVCIKEPLVLYRRHSDNLSNVRGKKGERFRRWSVLHSATFDCFYKDLKHAYELGSLSLLNFAYLGLQAKSWVASAARMEKWNAVSFWCRAFYLSPYLFLIGSRRHKKFVINNIF